MKKKIFIYSIILIMIGYSFAGCDQTENILEEFALTISQPTGGTIEATLDNTPILNGDKIEVGATIVLTAKADEGYSFSAWSGDASGNSQITTLKMTRDLSVSATFVANNSGGNTGGNTGGNSGTGIPAGDFSAAIEGVYGGNLKSSTYNETPYVVKLIRQTATVVSMECDISFLSNINFNINEENGNYYLTNATLDGNKISIRVSGEIMEITFTNAGGSQTSFVGKKDNGKSNAAKVCTGKYSGTYSATGDDAYIVTLEYVASDIVKMIDTRKLILTEGSAYFSLSESSTGYYKLSNSLYEDIDMTVFVGTNYTELRISYVATSGKSVTYKGKK